MPVYPFSRSVALQRRLSNFPAAALAICFMALSIVLPQPLHAAAKKSAKSEPVTQVYFMRGFMGIFSTGFDAMAKNLNSRKIRTEVYGHLSGTSVRSKIVKQWGEQGRRHKPIVLVGHSFGGNAALEVAARLQKENIPVALVITVDPTRGGPVSSNVKSYVNYFFPGNGLGAKVLDRGKVPSSRIKNIDMRKRKGVSDSGDDHWTVTHNDALQKEIMKAVSRAAR